MGNNVFICCSHEYMVVATSLFEGISLDNERSHTTIEGVICDETECRVTFLFETEVINESNTEGSADITRINLDA